MKKLTAIFLTVLMVLMVASCQKNEKFDVAEQLNLGAKYLLEQNYEQAILTYEAIIEIEPKNPAPYLGLADVYISQEDYVKAEEILNIALENIPENAEIQAKIEEVEIIVIEIAENESYGQGEGLDAEIVDESLETTSEETPLYDTTPVSFNDINIENKIREKLNKPTGDIIQEDLNQITELTLDRMEITDISDLSGLKNIFYLSVESNQITDISALSGLTNLKYLYLESNQITDISPISGLTKLEYLFLSYNQIDGISALSELTNISELRLSDNQISDISALSKLTNIDTLLLNQNQISDISVLKELTKLNNVDLYLNEITDWTPVDHVRIVNR